jgi:hypothetical protein
MGRYREYLEAQRKGSRKSPTQADKIAKRQANAAKSLVGLKAIVFDFTGDKDLVRALQKLRDSVARRVMKPAVGKAIRVIAKEMKNSVPTPYKAMKTLFASRVAVGTHGVIVAKAGAAVGAASKKKAKRKGGDKKRGVGISATNLHWLILGTDERTVKRTKMYRYGRLIDVTNWPTGKMPPLLKEVVRQGVSAGKPKAGSVLRDEVRSRLAKVVPANGN